MNDRDHRRFAGSAQSLLRLRANSSSFVEDPPRHPKRMLNVGRYLNWSGWRELEDCVRRSPIPPQPGLYRIRRAGRDELEYIGETGKGTMNLRKRVAMLKHVYEEEMPFSDPHTAGPGLWALLRDGAQFQVSFAAVQGTRQWRRGLEALAIALYRQEYKRSPSLNFGRMPHGYAKSSQRNSRLRGGPTTEELECHERSVEPAGPLTDAPEAAVWAGHHWSEWEEITGALRKARGAGEGLYRIRDADASGLLYVGQGAIAARLRAHARKLATPNDAQGKIFREAGRLEVSWISNPGWSRKQLPELENDLIAAHVLVREAPPRAQFIGGSKDRPVAEPDA